MRCRAHAPAGEVLLPLQLLRYQPAFEKALRRAFGSTVIALSDAAARPPQRTLNSRFDSRYFSHALALKQRKVARKASRYMYCRITIQLQTGSSPSQITFT